MADASDRSATVARANDAAQPRAAHLFLAPHYDDVALSCGGTVAALSDAGEAPMIVTIFGGEPAATDLTAFARWQHERWGTEADDTIATRLAEDRAAAATLGCATRILPFLDAIYRGDNYLSDEALFGPLLASDEPVVAQVVAAVTELLEEATPHATIYVPLGIGHHVDHQLVYRAGRVLASRGRRVLAYDDFPYSYLDNAAARRLDQVADEIGPPELRSIAATLERRTDAIAAYQTQLPVIFRFTDDWRAIVAASAAALSQDGTPSERYWPLRAES
jgi:LmbE family N-acetylglucosaminyl deacetylase